MSAFGECKRCGSHVPVVWNDQYRVRPMYVQEFMSPDFWRLTDHRAWSNGTWCWHGSEPAAVWWVER